MTDMVEPQSREEIYLRSSHQYIGALTNIEQRLVPKKASLCGEVGGVGGGF